MDVSVAMKSNNSDQNGCGHYEDFGRYDEEFCLMAAAQPAHRLNHTLTTANAAGWAAAKDKHNIKGCCRWNPRNLDRIVMKAILWNLHCC